MFFLVVSCDDATGTHEYKVSKTSLNRTEGCVLISSVLISVLISSVLICVLISSILLSEVEEHTSIVFGTVKV